MSQDFEFETRLRLALTEAAERTQHRSLAGRAIAAAPSLSATVGTLMAVIATLAVAAIFAVSLHRSASPLAPPQVVARLQLADSLGGGTTAAFGSVWLDDTTHDQLIRVDARTRRVVARLPVHGDVVSAAAAGGLWVLEGGHGLDFNGPLLRIDPRSNRITARMPLRTPAGKPFNAAAGGLLGSTQDVWVYGQAGVLHIDPRSHRATYAITTSAPPDSLASFGGDLWILTTDNHLLRFDARAGAPLSRTRVTVPNATDLGAAGQTLIAAAPEALLRLDSLTGRVLWHIQLPGASSSALTTPAFYSVQWTQAGGLIWTQNTGLPHDRVSAIDPDTGRVLTSLPLSDFGTIAITSTGSELWLATADGKVVILRPSDRGH
jgi:outer membrane protein assembly factor BamB